MPACLPDVFPSGWQVGAPHWSLAAGSSTLLLLLLPFVNIRTIPSAFQCGLKTSDSPGTPRPSVLDWRCWDDQLCVLNNYQDLSLSSVKAITVGLPGLYCASQSKSHIHTPFNMLFSLYYSGVWCCSSLAF